MTSSADASIFSLCGFPDELNTELMMNILWKHRQSQGHSTGDNTTQRDDSFFIAQLTVQMISGKTV